MNILLTGGTGYIGSHAAIALKEAGHNIVIQDNFSNSSPLVLNRLALILGEEVPFIEGDIRNTNLVKAILQEFSVDAVMHFAGLKSVGESVLEPLKYYENNVLGSLSLLRAMKESNVKKIVFSSSATVYGIPRYLPINEAHPLKPVNPYGRTKLQVEQILEDEAECDALLKVVNLRYFNPVGAHKSGLIGEEPRGMPNNLMPFIARVAGGKLKELHIYGDDYDTFDGTGVRDYIHVMDLAEGHVAALNYLPHSSGFETFNLGTGDGCSVLQMIEVYRKASGREIPFRIVGRRQGDISSCYAAPNKANQILLWSAKLSLFEMCMSSWSFQEQLVN